MCGTCQFIARNGFEISMPSIADISICQLHACITRVQYDPDTMSCHVVLRLDDLAAVLVIKSIIYNVQSKSQYLGVEVRDACP